MSASVLISASVEDRIAALEHEAAANTFAIEICWTLLTATIVFLMQYGFALLESGMCRKNNVTATYTKNMLDAIFGTMVSLACGFQLAYGFTPTTCVASSANLADGTLDASTRICMRFFHHLVFQATAATIMSGAMAERTTIHAYTILSCYVSLLFSIIVRWTWGGGWLDQLGFTDFAGASVVHVVGGAAATAGVLIVGAREGRYDPRRFYDFLPQDVSSVMSGALILWVGWYGFNMGSGSRLETTAGAHAVANSAVTTTVSAASGAIAAILLSLLRSALLGAGGRTVDAISLANGLLSGLVAITAGSNVVTIFGALCIGAGSAIAYMLASALQEALYLDDVVEAGAVHAGCGMWGSISLGLFHPDKGLIYTGSIRLLLLQAFGVTVIFATIFAAVALAAFVLEHFQVLRTSPEEEAHGLDHKFGMAASSYHHNRAIRMRQAAKIIEENGHSISDLIEALQSIKAHIYMTFSPQASDLVIDGQMLDILSRLDVSNLGNVGLASDRSLKDAIQSLSETMERPSPPEAGSSTLLKPSVRLAPPPNKGFFSGRKGLTRPSVPLDKKPNTRLNKSNSPAMQRTSSRRAPTHLRSVLAASHQISNLQISTLADVKTLADDDTCTMTHDDDSKRSAEDTSTEIDKSFVSKLELDGGSFEKPKPKYLAFLSHHKEDGGDAARVFVDTARRVVEDESGPDPTGQAGAGNTTNVQEMGDLIFLDSSNLSDLRQLLKHVEDSANYLILLTRCVLERPWVLAELVHAYKCGKRMVVILASWPGDDSSPQGRMFRFPKHLDNVLGEWQEFFYEASLRKNALNARKAFERKTNVSHLQKLIQGSVAFQRFKDVLEKQERPTNSSTWALDRWQAMVGLFSHQQSTFKRTLKRVSTSVFSFQQVRDEDEVTPRQDSPHLIPRTWDSPPMAV